MKERINDVLLEQSGFIRVPGLIQESWLKVLQDERYRDPWMSRYHNDLTSKASLSYDYRALSLSMCNDKGQQEYYLFLREGNTANRVEDSIVTLTRNLQFEDDLNKYLELLTM